MTWTVRYCPLDTVVRSAGAPMAMFCANAEAARAARVRKNFMMMVVLGVRPEDVGKEIVRWLWSEGAN